jgi:hypothetical protein
MARSKTDSSTQPQNRSSQLHSHEIHLFIRQQIHATHHAGRIIGLDLHGISSWHQRPKMFLVVAPGVNR